MLSTPAVSLTTASRDSEFLLLNPEALIPTTPIEAPTIAAKTSITDR